MDRKNARADYAPECPEHLIGEKRRASRSDNFVKTFHCQKYPRQKSEPVYCDLRERCFECPKSYRRGEDDQDYKHRGDNVFFMSQRLP